MQEEKKVEQARHIVKINSEFISEVTWLGIEPEKNMSIQELAQLHMSLLSDPTNSKTFFNLEDNVLFLGNKYSPLLLRAAGGVKPIVDFPLMDAMHALFFSSITKEKVESAKTVYPILVIRHNGRWRVLDGFNRIMKAALNGRTKIHARVMTYDDIKSCKVS